LIEQIEEKIKNDDKKKIIYVDDEDNLEIEVWKWVLIAPWRRVIFEQKIQALDEKAREENS
jgi:hypothetical protein